MAYDLVTWSPRVGASGDDKYNLPGATKLDGSVDSGEPSRIDAGSSSFSATPTIAEIDASSGVNQVIGLINRRAKQFDDAFGTSIGTLSYVTAETILDRGKFSSVTQGIFDRIDDIRAAEGFSDYGSFPASLTGLVIKGSVLAHCRKALGIYGTLQLQRLVTSTGNDETRLWTKDKDSPFSEAFASFGATPAGTVIGLLTAVSRERRRLLFANRVPSWLDDDGEIASAAMNVWTDDPFGSPALDVFLSDTNDVPLATGAAANMNYLLGTIASPPDGAWNALTLSDLTKITAKAGSYLCSIIGTQQEIAGSTTNIQVAVLEASGADQPYLEIDFG